MSSLVLGVNFGSTSSSLAIISTQGQAQVIADEDGTRQVFNAVSFAETEEYIGQGGKAQLIRNNQNTILKFRDLLGKDYNSVKDSFKPSLHSAALSSNDQGEPSFAVKVQGNETTLTVQQVTAKFLTALYNSAQDFLGRRPDAAVFAVPSHFTSKQKEALKEASKSAGVEIQQIITEQAAAAIAYGFTTNSHNSSFSIGDRNVVFLDVGAATTTASVLAVRSGLLTSLSEVTNQIGGDNIDGKLVDYFSKEFVKKNKGLKWDPENHRAVAKLTLEVEQTKRTLSASNSAACAIDSLADGLDFSANINRSRLNTLCSGIFETIIQVALEAIKKANLDPVQIQEVVLIGGTTKLPSLVEKLQDVFDSSHTMINSQIDPDEVIAQGCALQGELLLNVPSSNPVDQIISEKASESGVATLSKPLGLLLGSSKEESRFALLMDIATPLPARKVVELSIPSGDKDAKVVLSLWEGKEVVTIQKPAEKLTNGKKTNGTSSESESEEEEEEEIKTVTLKADSHIGNLVAQVDATPIGKGRASEPAKVRVTLIVGQESSENKKSGSLTAQQIISKAAKGGEVFTLEF